LPQLPAWRRKVRSVFRGRLVILLSVLLTALALAATAVPATLISFRTPSGNIGCIYSSGGGSRTMIRCDIRSGLKPRPPKPRNCDLDWGDSYEMTATGHVYVTCHGDTVLVPTARVLAYGRTWSRGGITCSSKAVGLRCKSRSGHGFFLSRQKSYRF
jgi:hypothetical protein